ncbi:MAG: CorA family divalent cation transporter [Pseudomonadota bacterium]
MIVQNLNYSAFNLDHVGSAKPLTSIEGIFPVHADQDSLTWLQYNKNDQTHQSLMSLGMIPKGVIDILCADETRPRTMIIEDAFVGIFRTVSAEFEETNIREMTSVRFFVNKNLIVTIQECPLLTMNRMVANFQANIGPKTAAECLMFLLNGISERIEEVITTWDTILDQLENAPSSDVSTQTKLTQLQKNMVALRRYLIPQRESFNRIEVRNLSWFDVNSQEVLKEEAESMVRLVEDLEAEKDRAALLQSAISSQGQQDTNQRMYFLSVVAAIFLPITFATGLLGVNLAGIPFAAEPWAFPAFCLTLLTVAGGVAIYLRYRKWF